MKQKFIFVTGGVLSGLGKGVSAASLGRLLKARGFKIFVQKFDPYYNVDPGTMNPYQHGEVFVTNDGGETDLDLGHYERFIDEKFTKDSNLVQGKLLWEVLENERKGLYDGETVQVIPHVTDKIIEKIEKAASSSKADFIITEIGGTVGDIESQPFMAAISQFYRKNRDECYFIHTTFVPYLAASQEFKTKPTQNSISTIQSLGVIPNMILLRSNEELDDSMAKKVAEKSYIEEENCIPVPNVDNIYKIPLYFEEKRMAEIVLEYFKIKDRKAELDDWRHYVNLIDKPKKHELVIGMIGKYVEYMDAYKSIIEALKISANWNHANVNLKWIDSSKIDNKNVANTLKDVDGVVILPGFGARGFEGKLVSAAYTREQDIPTFGICYGFQAMVIIQARLKGIKDATTTEISDQGSPVIDLMEQVKNKNRGGSLRLGNYTAIIKPNTLAHKFYGSLESNERHRHRYEFNNDYMDVVQDKDFYFSGFDKDTNLAEICEMPKKKFYFGMQAHPEFNATPLSKHPIFEAFIKAVIKYKK